MWINRTDTIVWDNSRPEAIEEIVKAWFNCIPCVKWPDSIVFWIETMKWYDILVTARSQNAIKEFNNYVWAKNKNWEVLDKPIDDFNHFIDGARYAVTKFFAKVETFVHFSF